MSNNIDHVTLFQLLKILLLYTVSLFWIELFVIWFMAFFTVLCEEREIRIRAQNKFKKWDSFETNYKSLTIINKDFAYNATTTSKDPIWHFHTSEIIIKNRLLCYPQTEDHQNKGQDGGILRIRKIEVWHLTPPLLNAVQQMVFVNNFKSLKMSNATLRYNANSITNRRLETNGNQK